MRVPEDFIRRVGQTGQADACGMASTLVSGAEVFELRSIERALKLCISRKEIGPGEMAVRKTRKTLASRTLTARPGEVFA